MRIGALSRTTACAFIAVTALSPSLAGSLETRFTTVTLTDMPLGHWTRVELADGTRYSVKNTSDKTVEVVLVAAKPFAKGRKLKPYTAVPDASWLTVKPTTLKLGPGKSEKAEVTLKVPNKPEFANRKYEIWLIAKTTGGQFGVGLVTRIRFNTVEKKQTDDTRKTESGDR